MENSIVHSISSWWRRGIDASVLCRDSIMHAIQSMGSARRSRIACSRKSSFPHQIRSILHLALLRLVLSALSAKERWLSLPLDATMDGTSISRRMSWCRRVAYLSTTVPSKLAPIHGSAPTLPCSLHVLPITCSIVGAHRPFIKRSRSSSSRTAISVLGRQFSRGCESDEAPLLKPVIW